MKKIFLLSLSLFFLTAFTEQTSVELTSELKDITSNNIETAESNNQSSWENFNLPFFGANLFQGNFKNVNFSGFNPNYAISVDDEININFWGALSLEKVVRVDTQGNIFIPEVGNIKVLNILQKDLNQHIKKHVTQIFNRNVGVYANLLNSKKIKVFVSGYVNKPGLYEGMSAGSVLSYIDRAGGIDLEKGSFRDVVIVRDGAEIYRFDFYNFLLAGKINYIQLQEGDVIKVNKQKGLIYVAGDVRNQNGFELKDVSLSGEDIIKYANPYESATDVNVIRNIKDSVENFVLPIEEFDNFEIVLGDKVEFLSHNIPKNITILIEGEVVGPKRLVVAYNETKLEDVLSQIKPSNRSSLENFILYRKSAAKRQKEILNQVLALFEQKLATYTPVSVDDATIHKEMIANIQPFLEKARKHQPSGIINVRKSDGSIDDIFLEDRDIIFIPKKTNLVSTFGYVNAPTFMAFKKGDRISDYIKASGGLSENAQDDYFLVRKLNGKVIKAEKKYKAEAGDEIIVLPELSTRTLQLTKDIFQIIYQMAVTARVITLF